MVLIEVMFVYLTTKNNPHSTTCEVTGCYGEHKNTKDEKEEHYILAFDPYFAASGLDWHSVQLHKPLGELPNLSQHLAF